MNTTCLNSYRRKRRQLFIRSYGERLHTYIEDFLKSNLTLNFNQLSNAYLNQARYTNAASWDYLDMREELENALNKMLGDKIFDELQSTDWFDSSLVAKDEILELLVSRFILLGEWAAIS